MKSSVGQIRHKKELKELVKVTKEYIEDCSHTKDFGLGGDSKMRNREVPAEFLTKNKKMDIKNLKNKYANCRACSLSETRNHLVFGEGDVQAKLVLIGEAPGRAEDLMGYPFVGQAGKLLDKILAAIGFKRADIYITNILKCRPPNNRDPKPEEVSTCEKILWEQLAAIKPKLICALGRFAAQTLLKTEERIGKLRGRWFELKGMRLMVTYHPAYLLRNPGDKRLVWEDMKKIRDEYQKIKR